MGWQVYKLGDLCTIEKGNIGITKAIPGEYPLVVLGEERKTHNEYQFENDAVIIPLVSSTGHGHKSMKRIHFQSGKFALGSILCAVTPKDKSIVSAQYLFRYLDLNKENELVTRMRGMANVSLPMNAIADIDIPLPPLKKQIEIVERFECLEKSNRKIFDELSNQITFLKNLRQQILQDAIQGKLVLQNPDDEPAGKLLQRIKAEKELLVKQKKIKKEKPLPPIKPEEIPFEIPKNWVWCRLGEIGTINPRNHIDDDLQVSFIPMNMISEIFGKQPNFEIKLWKEIKSGFTHFANNDVAIAKITPCFENSKACVFKKLLNGFGAGTTELHVFRKYSKDLSPDYIYINLKTKLFLGNGERIMRGVAGQQRVPTEYFSNFLVPLPPLREQHRIVKKIDQLMQYCDELEVTIQQNQNYTQELLQVFLNELFTIDANISKS